MTVLSTEPSRAGVHPVYSVATQQALASAHAVFQGPRGTVSRLAAQRGSSRQRLYRQAYAAANAVEGQATRQLIAQLRREAGALRQALAEVQCRLAEAVVIDPDRQAEFAATAQGEGVPFRAAHALLAVLLRERTPSRATLARLARQAGRRAGPALEVVDRFSHLRARQIAADEIFTGRVPVLMTAEQHSLCWLGGRLADNRDGPTWAEEFRPLAAAEQITGDRGAGLRKGLALVNAERERGGRPLIGDQSDHFHPLRRGRQQVSQVRRQAERALQAAERQQAAADAAARAGVPRTPAQGRQLRQAWRDAEAAFARWEDQERALQQLRAGLHLFTPDGELNTPERAAAEVEAALARLPGPGAAQLRRGLGPEAFTFLRRTHERLDALPVPATLRQAAVQWEGLKAQGHREQGDGAPARALRGARLVLGVALALAGCEGQQALALVGAVLRDAWRASSLIEGLNSVLRMHQARQKRLTQELLDLKRWCWNTHVFAAGKRKGKSPYAHLGVALPPGKTWWELLKMSPEQLDRELSALNPAA